MTPPKYIGPNDVPVIKAAVQQMLRDGVPRAQIAERLMAEYVPHDDVARLVARIPSLDAAHRFRHLRRVLIGLALLCLMWYLCCSLSGIYVIFWRPSGVNPARFVLPLFISLAFIAMPALLLAALKNNDGIAYPLGCFVGVVVMGDSLSNLMDDVMLVRLMFFTALMAGAGLSGLSFWVWRRYFPSLKLFSPPPKDAQGRYLFHDSAPPR